MLEIAIRIINIYGKIGWETFHIFYLEINDFFFLLFANSIILNAMVSECQLRQLKSVNKIFVEFS